MNFRKSALAPGLYLVATPIGNARDITLRALDVLASADVLVAEDTRTLLKLLQIHGIPTEGRRVQAFHDHSKERDRARLMEAIAEGRSVAYTTDAGTPLIADPGYTLVNAAREAGHMVTGAPGPSAVIAALTLAGLPTDAFAFLGFAPNQQTARREFYAGLATAEMTSVFYEAPSRIQASIADARESLGPDREAVVCREITKRFEEVERGPLGDLAARIAAKAPKGEYVVVVARADKQIVDEAEIDARINEALTTMRVKDAADAVAGALGLPRREIYQRALRLKSEQKP
ncbi:MAG: 16S rRNA (cytidine(1402)-2'-O)-methyltransferase [Pseudomonadota bacterium]